MHQDLMNALGPQASTRTSGLLLVSLRMAEPRFSVRLLVVVGLLCALPLAGQTRETLPASLSDREFWELSEKLSEPDGYFKSNSGSPDNLLSNENTVSTVAALLKVRVKPGGVYLGVGPEQNFSYIASTRPKIAFVTDIRRGNLHLHLMYKALFELSANRTEFVTRLFSLQGAPEGDEVVAGGRTAVRRAARRAG